MQFAAETKVSCWLLDTATAQFSPCETPPSSGMQTVKHYSQPRARYAGRVVGFCVSEQCVCVFLRDCFECVCTHTCLKGGALRSHAPCAGAAAFGHHDGELVQRVGLQACHHVVQAAGVGRLERERHNIFTIC